MRLIDYLVEFISLKDFDKEYKFDLVKKGSDEYFSGQGFTKEVNGDEIIYKFLHEKNRYEVILDKVDKHYDISFSANDSNTEETKLKDIVTLFKKIKACLVNSGKRKFTFVGTYREKEDDTRDTNARERLYLKFLRALNIKYKKENGDIYFSV